MVRNGAAPSIADIERLAARAWQGIPEVFRRRAGELVIRVVDFPDDETMAEMELETPFDILGLYRGVDLTRKSVHDVAQDVDVVFLYRRPLLDYWAESGEPLDRLVQHVLVHEIGHHFGFSDDDMARIEDGA